MVQPVAGVLALVLVVSTAAAQPRARNVTITGNPAEPMPVVYVAKGAWTTLVFDDAINPGAVKLEGEGTRERLVAVGDKGITLEPLVELDKRGTVLRADFADGKAPVGVALALVPSASEVDSHVRVSRHAQSVEALEAELAETRAREKAKGAEIAALRARCEASGPLGLVLARFLDEHGLKKSGPIKARDMDTLGGDATGLRMTDGWFHLAPSWLVLAVPVENIGEQPWTPDEATLTSVKTGREMRVRALGMKPHQLAPGEGGLVAVEADAPPKEAGEVFRLELRETATNRRLYLPSVKL